MELKSKMLDTLARVTQAQACAAKPPERFHEPQKTSISSWLEAAETYLEAKGVPLEDWPRTIETFLSEVSLVKVRRARVRDSARSYEQYKRILISILGKPEDREAKRVQLDQVRQFPSEGASDFASRVLELVSKAWSEFTPDAQMSMAIHHFVSGLRDAPTKDVIRQQQALHEISWPEVIRLAQAREVGGATPGMSAVGGPRNYW